MNVESEVISRRRVFYLLVLVALGHAVVSNAHVRTQKTVDIAYRSFEEVLVDLRGLSDEKIDFLLEDLRPVIRRGDDI
jgi:hypothetical protein